MISTLNFCFKKEESTEKRDAGKLHIMVWGAGEAIIPQWYEEAEKTSATKLCKRFITCGTSHTFSTSYIKSYSFQLPGAGYCTHRLLICDSICLLVVVRGVFTTVVPRSHGRSLGSHSGRQFADTEHKKSCLCLLWLRVQQAKVKIEL